MFAYYLKFAWRHLRKSLSYSVINIAGLALGIASVLLIFLYAQHELSFDEYHQEKDRIYRMVKYGGFDEKRWSAYMEGDLVPVMREDYTDVEDAVSLSARCGYQFTLRDEGLDNINAKCTESNLFNIFSFELLQGDPETVLDQPRTVVLARSLADRLFPDSNPIGETMEIQGFRLRQEGSYTITGIMEDLPVNTHFQANLLVSFRSLSEDDRQQAHYRYVLLEEGADPGEIADRALDRMINVLWKGSEVDDLKLEALGEIHYSSIPAERQGDISYLYVLSAIAVVILILACGNYLNLATARYVRRSKEIGIRKVLGAHRSQLVRQFFTETVLLSLVALPIAVYVVSLAIPWFNSYAGTELTLAVAGNLWFYLALSGILGLTGLAAGAYPALVVSSCQPTEALEGKMRGGFSASGLRKGLVTFQFLASIVMIGITAIILQQLSYVQNQNLGFDSDHLVRVNISDPSLGTQAQSLKQEFERHTTVVDATLGAAPATGGYGGPGYVLRPDPDTEETMTLNASYIDSDYLETLGIPLVAGRNVSSRVPEGHTEGLVNEQAVREMGYERPEEILGQSVFSGRFRIVGVVRDFNSRSLKHEIVPVLLLQNSRLSSGITLRLRGGQIRQGLEDLRATWEDAGAASPLNYRFVDDQLQNLYEQEEQTAGVIGIFAGLSILIAGMGLFGLAAFITEQRFSEIGIRKVMGAGIRDILTLLYRDFGILMGIAAVLSVPVIYVAGSRWLGNFAYRMEIGPSVFLIAIVAVLALSMLATGGRSLRAALMNPVDAIRDE